MKGVIAAVPLPRPSSQAPWEPLLAESITLLSLPQRTINMLEEVGIFTLADLLARERADLLAIPNFGQKTLDGVLRSLAEVGLVSADWPDYEPLPPPRLPAADGLPPLGEQAASSWAVLEPRPLATLAEVACAAAWWEELLAALPDELECRAFAVRAANDLAMLRDTWEETGILSDPLQRACQIYQASLLAYCGQRGLRGGEGGLGRAFFEFRPRINSARTTTAPRTAIAVNGTAGRRGHSAGGRDW